MRIEIKELGQLRRVEASWYRLRAGRGGQYDSTLRDREIGETYPLMNRQREAVQLPLAFAWDFEERRRHHPVVQYRLRRVRRYREVS